MDKYVLEQINKDLDSNGKVSNAVLENMMRNTSVKAEVLRELANSSQDRDDDFTNTTYSGTTFVARDTMTIAHSSGTHFARADGKIIKSNKFTSHSGDSPPEITSGASLKESGSVHQLIKT